MPARLASAALSKNFSALMLNDLQTVAEPRGDSTYIVRVRLLRFSSTCPRWVVRDCELATPSPCNTLEGPSQTPAKTFSFSNDNLSSPASHSAPQISRYTGSCFLPQKWWCWKLQKQCRDSLTAPLRTSASCATAVLPLSCGTTTQMLQAKHACSNCGTYILHDYQ